jgi:ABC-2 type transport system ATP-binding protein
MSANEESLVVAKDLGKRYGDFVALHPLNVKVSSGEFFGVFGPNGAGKSTFIKLLTGQLRPSIGAVEVLGIDAAKILKSSKPTLESFPSQSLPPPI